MERRLRPPEGMAAGVGATLVALAFLGLAHLVQPSVPFPPAGIAQRVVQATPGPLAVGAIELLGRWALRLFITGAAIATLALGAALGRWAANRAPVASWLAGAALAALALAGWQPGPGASLLTYAVLSIVAAVLWVVLLRGALERMRAADLAEGRAAAGTDAAGPAADGTDADSADADSANAFGAAADGTGSVGQADGQAGDPAGTPEAVPAGATGATGAGAGRDARPGRTRRELLLAGAGAGGLLLTGLVLRRATGGLGGAVERPLTRPAGAAPVAAAVIPAETEAERAAFAIGGLGPELTPNRDHYTIDESIIDPDIDAADWRLRVTGLVGEPTELTYEELLAMPAIEQVVTLVCISNYVGGELVGTARWTGVPLAAVLERAGGAKPGAVRVAFHAVGGYSDSLPVDKATDPSTVVAYGMNGVALPRAHGYPARIIAPGIYGMKNVKWLERIEVVDYEFEGYWQQAGWDNTARIRTGSRIDAPVPRLGGDLAAVSGELTVAGVAWAGDRGIDRVEVSIDDGKSWRPATLRRELAPAAWRQWRVTLPAPSGTFRVIVRAVDGTGAVQEIGEEAPFPSGATGYDYILVKG